MNYNFRVLFLGGIYPKENEKEIFDNSLSNLQIAANNCQWRFIKGFDYNLNNPIKIINSMYIGSYPKNYKKWLIKETRFKHTAEANDINLGFINIAYVKHMLKPFKKEKYIIKWINDNKDYPKIIFIYSISKESIKLVKKIKRKYKDINVAMFVGDLPQYTMMGHKLKKLANLYKRNQMKYIYNNINQIDLYALVSEYQAKKLKINSDKYIITETLANSIDRTYTKFVKKNKNIFIYAGSLLKQFGLFDLIKAFKKIENNDVKLVICGEGNDSSKEELNKSIFNDNRIEYIGVLKENEMFELFKDAIAFINPTNKLNIFTNYSFPIKNIDYLIAGRPVICQKFETFSEEYNNHFIYYENESELIKNINKICNFSEEYINKIGYENFEFVINNKSEIAQVEKILKIFKNRNEIER